MLFDFLDLIKSRTPPSLGDAQLILSRLREKQEKTNQHVAKVTTDLRLAVLDVASGADESLQRRASEVLAKAEKELSSVNMLVEAAEANLEAATVADRAATRKAQSEQVQVYLTAAIEEDVMPLVTHLIAMNEHWKSWLQRVEAARNVGIPLPAGGMVTLGEMLHAFENEIYRVGANPTLPAKSLPGGSSPSITMQDQPAMIQPLVERAKFAYEFITHTLHSQGVNHD